ncbi:unnamed protein product [Cunninghamella blakesleeana]
MEFLEDNSFLVEKLEKIQCWLQDVGSNIATPRDKSKPTQLQKTTFDTDGNIVKEIEGWIDIMDEELPKLTKFILPSGGKASATLHVSRAVCRRAERRVQPLLRLNQCDESVAIFLNRLSDFLFTAARLACKREGKEEKIYKK